MSANDVIDEIIYNVQSNVSNIDRKIDDRMDDPSEDVKVLAAQTRGLAQQIESLCTALKKREEYNREDN